MWNAITFEMSLDKTNYIRSVYNSLEYASDLGGLYGAVSPIFSGVLVFINFWGSY